MKKTLHRFLQDDTEKGYLDKLNDMVQALNFMNGGLALNSNFPSSIQEVTFSSGETKTIPHFLGVRPKYRIILRQEGNGVLSDIPSDWNEKVAVIKNNGAVTVTATIMFLKE